MEMPKKTRVIRAMATADAGAAQRPVWAPSRNQNTAEKSCQKHKRETEYRLENRGPTLKAASALGGSLVLVNTVTAKNLQTSDKVGG